MLVSCCSIAQSSGQNKGLSLKECMQYAMEHSPDMAIREAYIDDARLARRDAILAAFTPSVGAGTQLYSNFGRSIDPESNTYVSTASFNNAYSVNASLTLFNGFEAVNNMKISKTAMAIGIDERQLEEDRICLATIEAYCNVLYFSQMYEALQEQTRTAEQTLELVRRQEALGQKGYADVVQAQADLAERKYQMIAMGNSLNDSYITLKDIMFWPQEDSLCINDTAFRRDSVIVLEDNTPAEEIAEMAESTNPDILIAKARMENAGAELNTAAWQIAPSVSLSGGWGTSYYTYPGESGNATPAFWNQFTNNAGEYIQVSISIPIFNRLSRHSEIGRKKNNLLRMQSEYEKTLRNIRSEIHRAVSDRDGARAAYLQADAASSVQEEAYRLNSKKFEQGLISAIEYRSASESYIESRAKRLDALLKYYIKRSVVNYYRGIPYIDQEL